MKLQYYSHFILLFFFFQFNLATYGQGKVAKSSHNRLVTIENKIENIEKEIIDLRTNIVSPERINLIERKASDIKGSIDKLKIKTEVQDYILESQGKIVDKSFSGISLQLNSITIIISTIALVATVLALFLGRYIKNASDNIKNIKKDNEEILQSNIDTKKEIEDFNSTVTSSIDELYPLIVDAETNHLLDRLVNVPEDISNLFYSLVSRQLNESHFLKLKKAFLWLKESYGTETNQATDYLSLFFQNYIYNSMIDDDLKEEILSRIDDLISGAFINDIIFSTSEYFRVVKEVGVVESKREINTFVKSIGNSKFKDLIEIPFTIYSVIEDRNKRFELFTLIDKDNSTLFIRKEYGKYLLDYENYTPNDSESFVIIEIKKILATDE